MTDILGIPASEIVSLIRERKAAGERIKRHPNGFLQLSLSEIEHWRAPGLRLHIWTRFAETDREDEFGIHDHVFDIRSAIIAGALENTFYRVVDDPAGGHKLYVPTSGCIEEIGQRVRIEPEKKFATRAGEEYLIPKGTFHSARRLEEFTVTIIAKERTEDRQPKIVGPASAPKAVQDSPRDDIDQEECWKHVEKAIALLER